jgi:hypothetical protein
MILEVPVSKYLIHNSQTGVGAGAKQVFLGFHSSLISDDGCCTLMKEDALQKLLLLLLLQKESKHFHQNKIHKSCAACHPTQCFFFSQIPTSKRN